ncbi:hypothetical protein BROUX41_002742 [Berkeleyomyces rouxiae]|uniref:uncharacterized protein n=1 Tax=Berkeleyomyces rouxiae TaxID=2035830 RepID=UPI003B7722AE
MSETSEVDPIAQALDDEITTLQAQVASLKQQLRVQATNLLTSESIHRALLNLPPSSTALRSDLPTHLRSVSDVLATRLAEQQAHDQQSLYRLCASITSFRVLDPDPYAIDDGKVFGLRFEVMVSARFLRPYYVLLNRPWTSIEPASKAWQVHKHTIPPAIPLSGLVARFLPPPPSTTRQSHDEMPDTGQTHIQDLLGFAKALRREIYRYHNRIAAIADLRRASGVSKNKALEQLEDDLAFAGENAAGLLDIGASDPEAKHIAMTWVDGRTGRVIVDDDGNVKHAAVFANGVPDLVTGQRLKGNGQTIRLEDLIERLEDPPEDPLIEGETLGV